MADRPIDDLLHVGPDERLSAGELHRPDVELAGDPDEPFHLLGAHLLRVRGAGAVDRAEPLVVAVNATEVAPLGHADADIGHPATHGIDQHSYLSTPPEDLRLWWPDNRGETFILTGRVSTGTPARAGDRR